MKTNHDPKVWLITVMLAVLSMLVLTAAFFVLKPAFRRFSLDFYYPAFRLLRSAEGVVVDRTLLLKDRKELAAAVTALHDQNERFAAENAEVLALREENRQLRDMLKLQAPRNYGIVHAEVLMRDPATWLESFVIDRGSDAGIHEGDLVISTTYGEDGKTCLTAVVGRIREVSKHTATVVTLYNNSCTFGGFLQNSMAYGMLAGSSRNGVKQLRISCLPPDKKYAVNEPVLTSRYSRNFPEGVYIGKVAANPDGTPALHLDSNGLSAEGVILPALDISRIRFVTVLTGKDQAQ